MLSCCFQRLKTPQGHQMEGWIPQKVVRAARHLETVISPAKFLDTLLCGLCSGDTKLPVMAPDIPSCLSPGAFAWAFTLPGMFSLYLPGQQLLFLQGHLFSDAFPVPCQAQVFSPPSVLPGQYGQASPSPRFCGMATRVGIWLPHQLVVPRGEVT